MKLIIKLIKWFLSLFTRDKVKEIEYDADKEVGKVSNGADMSDFLNDKLRDK